MQYNSSNLSSAEQSESVTEQNFEPIIFSKASAVNLSVSTLIHRKASLDVALDKIALLGIRCVELCVDAHHSDPKKWQIPPMEMVSKIHNSGIIVNSIHIPLPENQRRWDSAQIRANSLNKSLELIDLAVFFSAGFVVQHVALDSPIADHSGSILDHTIPELNQLAAYAQKRNIVLALENVPAKEGGIALGDNPLDVMIAIEALGSPAVGMCFDVSHCVATGYDPLQVLRNLNLKKLISLHISDNLLGLHEDLHLPLGKGQIHWPDIFNWLSDKGFNGSVVVEVVGDDEESRNLVDSLVYLESQSHFFHEFPELRDGA